MRWMDGWIIGKYCLFGISYLFLIFPVECEFRPLSGFNILYISHIYINIYIILFFFIFFYIFGNNFFYYGLNIYYF